MAIPSELKEVGGYAIKFGAIYLAYVMAQQGAFGSGLQTVANQLGSAFGSATSGVSGVASASGLPKSLTTTTTAGGGNNAAGVGTPAGAPASGFSHQGGSTSPALTSMISQNANFVSQATTWRQIRAGQAPAYGPQFWGDPNNWAAFRSYETGIGAPDPGYAAPPEWPSYFGGTLSCPTGYC